jgi:Asp-tRNA(Asn)/Glu-tRNA(Gln) amidotransferase A subunit family amidase
MAGIPAALADVAQALRNGQLQIADYITLLESRYAAREPSILAFMPEPERFSRLRLEAAALLGRWPRPDDRPALFGVPVGVKDIMHVAGMPTTGGSRLPPDVLRGPESACVSALKAAGALIMGKTVSTEFAYFGAGPTRNPHDPNHTPGGSSSGSAAAVAAGLCPVALGTQTVGSIIRPAAFCGVVGYKPSHERISKADVIPLAPSLDHVGLFASDVRGVALAASVLARDWHWDPPEKRPTLGIPEGPYLARASDEALAHFRASVEQLRRAGYPVVAVNAMPDFDTIRDRHNLIVAAEAARVHVVWYASFRELYHPKTAALIELGQTISNEKLAEALAGREKLRAELLALMEASGIDLWMAPAAPGAAPRGLESTGDPVMNLPWTHSGLPAVSVPAGRAANGLPLGLQVVGRWQADEHLLAWAQAFEEIVGQSWAWSAELRTA